MTPPSLIFSWHKLVTFIFMGNCSSKSDTHLPDPAERMIENDKESFIYNNSDDDDDDDDMISLDRLFSSESADRIEQKGTTAGIIKRPDVPYSGDDGIIQIDESRQTAGNKTVRFQQETMEQEALKEIFSEEALLNKKRKSFSADMKIFSLAIKGPGQGGTEGDRA